MQELYSIGSRKAHLLPAMTETTNNRDSYSTIKKVVYVCFTLVLVAVLIHCVLTIRHQHHQHHIRHSHHYHRRSHFLSDAFINSINSQQNLWTAGRNFDEDTPLTFIKGLMGTVVDHTKNHGLATGKASQCDPEVMPLNFDARENWPYCSSINKIRDQGGCGSCWAVGVASVMTDRICTLTTQTETVWFSDEDILTCCNDCLMYNISVCDGGSVAMAWSFARHSGVVSGGDYKTTGGCKAYGFKPCDHKYYGRKGQCTSETGRRACLDKCTSNLDINYEADQKYFSDVYFVRDHVNPMCEIYEYGPIAAVMIVYTDFVHYKSGVYRHVDTKYEMPMPMLGNHTVKILGWGVEEESQTKYWLVANSWGSDWGDGGFFKIVRGENHCGIEGRMTAGKL